MAGHLGLGWIGRQAARAARAHEASLEIRRLLNLSDGELASLGLSRDGVVAHVARRYRPE